ncbi:serine/threonine-protein kinase [Rubripirellula amarantea]|nr:serine/threonine-protein kinase [Rubripirellula amarantea]
MERYEVFESLGSNHFAEVFNGYDHKAGRDVALLQMHSSFFSRPDRAASVWDDVLSAIRVSDRNLVPIHDVERENHRIVMEKMEGNLQTRIAQAGLAPKLVRSILRQVLEGLVAIHDAGRLHGDVKPGQVLFNREGRIQLGFSPGFYIGGSVPPRPEDPMHQTPELIKPEVFGAIGPASDLYMAGFAMAEILAGPDFQRHFDGAGHNPQMIFARWHGDPNRTLPAVKQLVPSIPSDLGDVVDRLLRKQVSERFQSASEVLRVLDDAPVERIQVPTTSNSRAPRLTPVTSEITNKFDSPDYVQKVKPLEPKPTKQPKQPVTGGRERPANASLPLRELVNKKLESPIAKGVFVALLAGVLALVAFFSLGSRGTGRGNGDSEPSRYAVEMKISPNRASVFEGDSEIPFDEDHGGYVMTAGEHKLTFTAEGYNDEVQTIVIDEAMDPIQVSLEPAKKKIAIEGFRSSDTLLVDGKSVTVDPATPFVELAPGACEVVFQRPLHSDISMKLEVETGIDPEPIRLEWKQTHAMVEIEVVPKETRLRADDEPIRVAEGEGNKYKLPLGSLTLAGEMKGYDAYERVVSITTEQIEPIKIVLVRIDQSEPKAMALSSEKPKQIVTFILDSSEKANGTLGIAGTKFNIAGGETTVDFAEIEYKGGSISLDVAINGEPEFTVSVTREDIEDGVVRLRRSLSMEDDARFTWLFAREAVRSDNADLAERQLTRAVELDGNKYQFYRDRAIARATQGKTNIAKEDFDKALGMPGGANDFYLLQEYAFFLAELGKVESSVRLCGRALGLRDHATAPRMLRQRYDAAVPDAEKLLRESYDKEQLSYAKNLLGLVMMEGDAPEKGLDQFKAAIDLNPENSSAYINVGKAAREIAVKSPSDQKSAFLDMAMAAYNDARKLNPELEEQVLSLVAQLEFDAGDAGAAISTMSSLIEKYGESVQRYERRSALYKSQGMETEALKDQLRIEQLKKK